MPTPVNTARQCLTQEGVTALDEAVSVAKRRGHSQTTSLHMVSSLLSLPDSILRQACMHARNNFNYSSRAQFKALELSLSVSLDRLPSSSKSEKPPVSNSLMAAMKRSQANQRRQPENFSFYQQQEKYSGSSSVPVVKVELKNLILSILDDPLVSRVLGEAGFRSCDVKMALIRPNFHGTSGMFGAYNSRYRRSTNGPPMFLCNFGDSTKGFNFPFMGCFSSDQQQSSKRISEVMVREKKRNPLLLGVGASDILTSFLEMVRSDDGSKGVLPEKLGLVSVKDEVLKLIMSEDSDEELKFDQVGRTVADSDYGVVVNLGDWETLAGVSVDNLRLLVGCLSNLLQVHRGKLWLIGAVTTYDAYFKVLGKVSTIEQDWDLETVPITSLRFSMGGSYPRSNLMESFVPLGGFFSMPSEIKIPLINQQEIATVTKRAERYHSTLPRWLTKGKDDKLLNAEITEKWDDICREHHYNQIFPPRSDYQFPRVTGFRLSNDREEINDSKSPSSSSNVTHHIRKSSLNIVSKDDNPTTYLVGSDPKLLYQALVDKIGDLHQQAISAFAQAITRCQTKHGVARNGLWINLKGPDLIFKIKLGLGLAETLFLHGSTESFVCVDLDLKPFADTLFNNLRVKNRYDATMRVTVIEYLVEILSRKQPCIVFLENIDKADLVVQSSLSLAMETGKLTDSRGREANIGNSVFLVSARYREEEDREDLKNYSEEDVLRAKGSSIKLLIRYDLNDASDVLCTSGKGFFDANHLNKRKIVGGRSRITDHESLEVAKRANKSSSLDLNLPADEEENEVVSDLSSENSSTSTWWSEDFERRMDQVVAFEPFDFDALAEKLNEEACKCLRDVVGYKCSMEIERKVMQQFLAAALLYGKKEVENWIQNVSRHGFEEAMGKFGIDDHTRSTVKLTTCDNMEDLLLPPTIIFN